MMDYLSQNLWLIWTVVMFVCLLLELSSGDFYVTCFAIGAIVCIPVAVVDAAFWVQVVLWAVCSILSIWLVRPRLVAAIHRGANERRSNADALAGQVGVVSQTIMAGGYGRVKLDGDDWKAEAPGATADIASGERVRVLGHESVILRVERLQEPI